MSFKISMTIVVLTLCTILTQSTSKCEGVSWNEERKRWQAEFNFDGKTSKYYFKKECDAIKTINQVYKKMTILSQNPEICDIPNQGQKEKTSQYKGVCWHKKNKKWVVMFDLKEQLPKYGGCFSDELGAATRVNELCKELGIPEKNPGIRKPNQKWKRKENMSQYKGVFWNKQVEKWIAVLYTKGQTQKYGGIFKDELDAAKKVNQLCEESGIPPRNLEITGTQNQQLQKNEKISQYKGVTWHKQYKKWYVELYSKDGKLKYGGTFNDELDAAKRVNEFCKELGIPEKNPGINGIPNQHWKAKEKTSQYKGVCWHKENKKWYVRFDLHRHLPKYGGCFKDELDAAKRVNELCKELGIPEKNPGIGIPNQHWKAKEKTSQYKGVHWHKKNKAWHISLRLKNGKKKYGGSFSDELDAAKRVNQLCEEMKIPQKNPGIGTTPYGEWKAKEKTSQYKGVCWHRETKKWYAAFRSNGRKTYGGSFGNELDAAKTINQLCEELKIPEKNPGIGKMPLRPWQRKEKTSKYKGVHWHTKNKKWFATLNSNGNKKYGGSFSHELDAAKSVNQLCEEFGIPEKNPGIGTMINRQWQATRKTSQYKGVHWHKANKKWYVLLRAKDGKLKYGGRFSNELDAAEEVNQLCKEMGIPEKNPGIGTIPPRQCQHKDNSTIVSEGENSVIDSEIIKTDDSDGTKEKKRNSIKNFIIDDKSSFKQYYFYEELLK